MSLPVIGLVGRRKYGQDILAMPAPLDDQPIDLYFSNYAVGVSEAGGLPIHLPLHVAPAAAIGILDGLVITGGADIGPACYGAEPETDEFPPEPERDRFELELLAAAADRNLPVLGICRGHQMINVWAGGTLHQDVPPHARFDIDPATEVHEVRFEAGSVACELYGDSRVVNSLHHQTLDRLGRGVIATGHADDGTVEALEVDGLRWLGVQWHPEMMHSRSDEPALRWLIEQAAGTKLGR